MRAGGPESRDGVDSGSRRTGAAPGPDVNTVIGGRLPDDRIQPILRGRGVELWGVGRWRASLWRQSRWYWRVWDVLDAAWSRRGRAHTLKAARSEAHAVLAQVAGNETSGPPGNQSDAAHQPDAVHSLALVETTETALLSAPSQEVPGVRLEGQGATPSPDL
jgi:hypothetical protein